MEALDRAVGMLVESVERLLAVALIVGVSLNFTNVIGRYLVGVTLTGVDEVEIYILIWIAFLGAAAVSWKNQHLRMDVLLNASPRALRKAVFVFETGVMLAVASFVTFLSFSYVQRIHALGAVSDVARIPTWIPHSAIVLGFGAMSVMVVLRGIRVLRGAAADVR